MAAGRLSPFLHCSRLDLLRHLNGFPKLAIGCRDTVASIAAANNTSEVALLVVNPQITDPAAPLRPGSVVNLP